MVRAGIMLRTSVLAIVAIMATPAFADDEFFGAGGVFGGPAQKRAVCYFSNLSNETIKLKGYKITDPNGTALTLAVDECSNIFGGLLNGGWTCGIAADVSNNLPYNCLSKISVANKPNVRGTFELRDASQNVVVSQPLQ